MSRSPRSLFALTLLILAFFTPATAALNDTPGARLPLVPLSVLNERAQQRLRARPRTTLSPPDLALFKNSDPLGSAEVPNYLRALAPLPNAVRPFADLVRAALYSGQVAPELKMAMGLRMAQINASPYVAAHMQRLLRVSDAGRKLLTRLESGALDSLSASDRLALAYADALTRDVHGVSDADFAKMRGVFNDSQIVELTMNVCFFNYFTRLAEALNLPVEPWVLKPAPEERAPAGAYQSPVARIGLISDEEMSATAATVAAAKDPARQAGGLGLGIANSQRAMLRAPAFALAWRTYGTTVREYSTVSREIKLHVSFAVSMVNGCRYCTIHQVLGLRRLGVDPAKLVAMKKDDAALTPRELTAVEFARKLTREPASITDADYEKLKAEFTEPGALEVVLQTSAFSFMNRFTDGLRLPSEDEAIRVYHETYGTGSGQ